MSTIEDYAGEMFDAVSLARMIAGVIAETRVHIAIYDRHALDLDTEADAPLNAKTPSLKDGLRRSAEINREQGTALEHKIDGMFAVAERLDILEAVNIQLESMGANV